MSLKETLNADMKQAMKDKDKQTLSVLRVLKAAIQNEEIKTGNELTDEDMLTVLSREMKQRQDAKDEFQKASRDDLVAQQDAEMEVIQRYLPEPLTTDELKAIVEETINETGANSMKDMGQVMSAVLSKVKGRANGKEVNEIVRSFLN